MRKPKILMVADIPGWAWDRNVEAIKKYLSQYDIQKAFSVYYGRRQRIKFESYDHVHFCGWLEGRGVARRVSAGICSHNFELRKQQRKMYRSEFPQFKALTANSKLLYDHVKQLNPNTFHTPNGVHEDIFYPMDRERKEFVVGWVGQKTHGSLNWEESDKGIDIKGYQHILKPLMHRLEPKGVIFKVHSNLPQHAVSYERMPDFYRQVDVQICTSLREGTPNPMFEAAACGKPLISTRVGAISEFIQHGENGYLIESYSCENNVHRVLNEFEKAILHLKNNRDLCKQMGIKARELIEKKWTWKERAKQFIPLFEHCLKHKIV